MFQNLCRALSLSCVVMALLFASGCDGGGASSDASDTASTQVDGALVDVNSMMQENDVRDLGSEPVTDADLVPDAVRFGDASPLPMRPECDDTSPPVVMAHGFLASSDTWAGHVQRFVANGLCVNRYHGFDWNSLDRNADHLASLDVFIDAVLAEHGTDKVDLFGHSAGGGLGYSYLESADRAAKVRRYVHIGSFPSEGPAGPVEEPVPTLNLWSPDDRAVEGQDIPGATNVQLGGEDHYAVATSERSFSAIYQFLHDQAPSVVAARNEDRPMVRGRIVSLGENQVEDGGRVEIWVLNSDGSERVRPVRRFEVGPDGYWGPFVAEPGLRYEFYGVPSDPEAPPVRYFREPFSADLPLMYLRTLPGPGGGIASVLLSLLPLDGDTVPLVVYNASGAFLAGRDSLTLDGQQLLTDQSAPAENTSIALFVFDVNNDGESGGTSPLFDMFPFLAAVDLPIEAAPGDSMSLVFNGRTLLLPKERPEAGVVIAVFE